MSKHRRPRATVTADSRTTDPASQSPDSTTPDHLAVDTQTRTEDRTSAQATATATARTRRQQRALDRAKARADKAYARDRAALAAARAEAGRPEIDYDADPDTITEPKMVGYEITLWRLNPLDTDATDETGEPTQAHESAEAFPDEDSDTDAAPEAGSTAAPETTLAPHPEAHEPVITYADLYEGPAPHTTEHTTDAAGDVHSTPTTHDTDDTDDADDTDNADFEGDGIMLAAADHDTTHPDHPLHLDTHFSRARARQARLDARAQARAQAAAAAILARREKQAAKALARIERAEKKQAATPTRTPAHPAGETPAPLAVTDVPEVEDTQDKTIHVEAPVASVETDNPHTNPDTAYAVTHTQRTHTVPLTTPTPDHATAPTGDRTALPAADRGTDRAAARAAARAAKAAARTERLAAKAAAREAARAARAEKKAARAAAKASARQARADAKAAKKNKNRAGLTNPFAQRTNDYDQFATGLSTAAVSGFTTPRPGEAITPDLPPLPVDEMLASFDTAANSGAYTGAPDELGFTDADTWTGHDTDPHHTSGVINQATWTPPPVPGLDTGGIDPETGQPFDLITSVTDHPDYDPTFDAAEHLTHHTDDTADTDDTVRAGETYGREFALTTNITTELHDTPDTDPVDTADDEPDEPAPTPLATITSTINATSRRGRRKADIEAELAARQSDYDAMFSATTTEAPSTPAAPGAPTPPAAVTGTDTPGTAAPATGTLRDALNNPRTLPTHLKQHPRHLAAAAATALALLGLTGYLLTAPAADQATATSATLPTTTNTAPASPVDTPLLIDLDQDNAADTTLTTTAPDGTTLDINIPDTTRDRALITTALPPTQDTTPTTDTGTGAGTPTTTRTLATALVPATDPWWLTIRNMAPDLTTWSNNTPAAAPRKTRWYALTTSPRTPNHPAYNHLHLGFTTAEAAKNYADKTNPDLATTTLRGTVLTLTHPDTTTYNPTWADPTPEQAQALDNLKPTVGTWTINYGHATDPAYRASTLLTTLGYGPGTIWTAIADNPTSPWIGNLTAHTPPHKGATLDTALTGQETVLTNLLTASGYTTKNDTLGNLPAPTLDEGPTGTVLAYALAAATTPWDLTSDTLAGTQGTNPTGAPSRIWVTNNGTQVIDTP